MKSKETSLEPFSGLVGVVTENEEGESVWEKIKKKFIKRGK